MTHSDSNKHSRKNTDNETQFPLAGVIGVVAESAEEITQAKQCGLSCVELRVDLLLSGGSTVAAVIAMVAQARQSGLAVLVTIRHPSHGGKFDGTEPERVSLCQQMVEAGANIVDLEWDSEAANLVGSDSMDLILSYHNFESMISATELDQLTHDIQARKNGNVRAIKVVPTASSVSDAASILDWVDQGQNNRIARIGFAMGKQGACSRLLTTAFGGAVTYASFGAPVAPGQIDLHEMLDNYRVPLLDGDTRITAVIGAELDSVKLDDNVTTLNDEYAAASSDSARIERVAIGFDTNQLKALENHKQLLRIDNVIQL